MVVNVKALRTQMKEAYKLQGYTVAVEDGVMLIDPRYEALIVDKKGVTSLGSGLYAQGEISGAWIMKVDKKGHEAQLKHLAGMRWVLT